MSDIPEPAELVEARDALAALQEEATRLADIEEITAEDDQRLGEILDFELDEAEQRYAAAVADYEKAQERAAKLEQIRNAPPEHRHKGIDEAPEVLIRKDPLERRAHELTRSERRDAAMRLIEGADHLAPEQQERAAKLVATRRVKGGVVEFDGDEVAKRFIVTGNPHYGTAFQKAVNGQEAEWTNEERAAVSEFRYQSLTNASGGFGVPTIIDPTIILTSGAADAPVLSVARIETITNDVWRGVSAPGVSWSFDTEGAEVSDDSVTLAQPSVTAHAARGFVPYSVEIEGDYPGFAAEFSALLSQGYVDLLAANTATGTGTNQPWGVFTAVAQHQTPQTEVLSATNGEINSIDIRNVWADLPERFRGNASWFMNVSVENQVRTFGNGNNHADFTTDLTAEGVTLLNGRRVLRSDYAPDFSTTTTVQTDHLVVGDFRHYVVAQRVGMTVERVPHLFATANNLPNLQRGLLAWARVGADVVVDNAFRVLINASV